MILVIGGLSSGKRDFVKNQYGFSDGDIADGVLDALPVVANLQNLVAASPETCDGLLPALLTKQVVVCNEVGSGVVPIDKTIRAAREATGRLCVALAEKAETVVRVCCGVPVIIKGTL